MFQFGRIWIAVFIIFMCVGSQPVYALNAPVLSSPANGTQYSTVQSVTFRWGAVFGATSYLFQLSQNAAMTQIVYQTSTVVPYVFFSGFQAGKTYYWRVQALSPPSAYSSVYSIVFTANTDCVVSEWSSWQYVSETACSCSWYNLTEKRNRVITVQPAGSGLVCPVLEEIRTTVQTCGVPIGSGYCAQSMPVNPFRYNGTGDGSLYVGSCRYELPSQVAQSVIDGSPCFGDDIFWYDKYDLRLAYSCADDHLDYCINGDWRYCSGSYVSGWVPVPGYSCWNSQGGWEGCPVGKQFFTCEEAKTYGLSQISDLQLSNKRSQYKTYLGMVYYKHEDGGGHNVAGYKVFGEAYCDDEIILKRTNDIIDIKKLNEETYQFVSVYHNKTSVVSNLVKKYIGSPVESNYRGLLAPTFNRGDVVPQKVLEFTEAGWFAFQVDIIGTQCIYNDWHFVGKPDIWGVCDQLLNSVDTVKQDALGIDFYNTGFTEYAENFEDWQIWRYPVDKYFKPTGSPVLVSTLDSPFSYITSPGGSGPDITLEKGYKYRYRSEYDGFLYSYDFGSWPCAVSQGVGVNVRAKGGNSQGNGFNWSLPGPVLKGVQWQR